MKYLKRIFARINLLDIDNLFTADYSFDKAKTIIPFFYFFLVVTSIQNLVSWSNFASRHNYSPFWPIFWANSLDPKTAYLIIMIVFLASSLISSFFYWNRLARMVGFLGIFQYHALLSSFGAPDHEWYLFLYVGFIFIFLPDVFKTVKEEVQKKKFLLIFWTAQAFVFLTYSMSGISKLIASWKQFLAGEDTIFSINAAALHTAQWLHTTNRTSLLGPQIIENPIIGWIPFIIVVYLEVFALYAAFKPSLHRIWAMGLIIFLHIGTYISMNLIFQPAIYMLLFLFLNTPFRHSVDSLKEILLDLPIFGWILKMLIKVKKK